ncbi:hypothetical protein NP233_g9220 [Leucocoprinus birnbaumii]|uniref:Aminoacyl-transfer RNA synthetases class-II family profile domain-containing protein n=1 Tax=Leucocoprinus birnbaumii TaxID=56174 RepID=A0AAD5YR25_9AGAR|nr:hypothetical protein NP233_g9220 [Leucocoprinus birnbaumii]
MNLFRFPARRAFAHCAPFPRRTHNCGDLNASHVGARVVLAGWLLPGRKGKLVSFFPLKDSYGTTQLILSHSQGFAELSALADVSAESSVLIEGTVSLRPEKDRRQGTTGEIDVQVEKFTVLNQAAPTLPFTPSNPFNLPNDDLRARYRYLDLRRTALSDNIKKRNFLEVETPVLLRSSPEGAREFLVPTRLPNANVSEKPLFYALQQSPQQPKQLLICSGGVDRYFQLAKCFRDEDGRKDRQPEFTQVDLEMAYVSWGPDIPAPSGFSDEWRIGGSEVRQVVESLIRKIWLQMEGITLPDQFRVMTYREAMTRYGSDKPDTRFGLEIMNITPHLPPDILSAYERNEEVLECIIVRKSRDSNFIRASKACKDNLDTCHIHFSQSNAETWLKGSGLGCELLNRLTPDRQVQLNTTLGLRYGDDIWLSKRSALPKGGSTSLGRVRLRLSELAQMHGDFAITADPHFLWITEFPLFTRADEDKDFLAKGRWSSSHHPFTAPMWQDIEAMYRGDIEQVRGQHYDLVLNGVEIGGGSVRVHDAAMQDYIFGKVLQVSGCRREGSSFYSLIGTLLLAFFPNAIFLCVFSFVSTFWWLPYATLAIAGEVPLAEHHLPISNFELTEQEKAPFDQLLHALKCGAPPHGGIALGFDRLMAILCKTQSIRDVIAFPKTSTGTDLLFKSPATIIEEALRQYGLRSRAETNTGGA